MTTPTDEQFYDRLAPDLKRKVDLSRAAQAEAKARADQLAQINVRLARTRRRGSSLPCLLWPRAGLGSGGETGLE